MRLIGSVLYFLSMLRRAYTFRFLYEAGYKVWLGSLCTDGIRLVSDGADNTIVVHNFEWQQENDNSTQGND